MCRPGCSLGCQGQCPGYGIRAVFYSIISSSYPFNRKGLYQLRQGTQPDTEKESDSGAGDEPEDSAGGQEQTSDTEQRPGKASDPSDFDPTQAGFDMGAIDQFDQLGAESGTEQDENAADGEMPGAGGRATLIVMEQLLEQVEGNPSHLMRNQFMLEEQRMNEQGGRLYEPRPW